MIKLLRKWMTRPTQIIVMASTLADTAADTVAAAAGDECAFAFELQVHRVLLVWGSARQSHVDLLHVLVRIDGGQKGFDLFQA